MPWFWVDRSALSPSPYPRVGSVRFSRRLKSQSGSALMIYKRQSTMRKFLLSTVCATLLPVAANASTVVIQGGGPYNVQSDNLFFGTVSSNAGGAGSFTIDFLNSSGAVLATADAAVTSAAVNTLFTGLTISWLDGSTLNTLIQAPGIDTLPTVFSGIFQSQRLVFDWSNSVAGAGFGFDVATQLSEIPVPAALPLFLSALFGLAFASGRRRGIA